MAGAALLFHQTFELALRLPKRWTFYLSERMVDHAEQVLHHVKSANSIYVSCAVDAQLRRMHLQQAYCHAQALNSPCLGWILVLVASAGTSSS